MRFPKTRFVLTFLCGLAATGTTVCDDFATPAELETPQILGIAADPPAVAPGAATTMSLLVAGPDGEIETPSVVWEVVSLNPAFPPVGTVDDGSGAPIYTAPDMVEQEPTLAMVQASVQTSDGLLLGQKAVVVAPFIASNPTLVKFTADTVDLLTNDLQLAQGQTVSLELGIDPEQDQDTTYSWYSTIGSIEQYRSAPAEMVAPDEAGSGWLFAVIRDGRGGIVWHKVRVTVL